MSDPQEPIRLRVSGGPRYPSLAEQLTRFDEVEGLRKDAWQNAVTKIGTSHDKVSATTFAGQWHLAPAVLQDLYHNDDVAARICDLIPQTSLREPFMLNDEGLAKDMDALGVCEKFEDAWTFGRLDGGGPIVLGGNGASDTPLTDGVTSMMVIDRYQLAIWEYYTDTRDPKYGLPKIYRIMRPSLSAAGNTGTFNPGELIHESRIIIFGGARTSPRRKLANGYWDDSVLQRVYQVVQAYGLTWASVIHLLQDAAQGVYSMKDLWNLIVSGNKAAVTERMALVDEQRSSARAILIDADGENFTRVPTPFTGIPELIDRISERLASASGYPLTVLMGSSPAGMNATGKSDLEIYYGRCEVERRKNLTPAIIKLATAMGHDTSKLSIHYPPLWMATGPEAAKMRYQQAQADNIYVQMGFPPQQIVASRFRANGWSGETEVPEGMKLNPPPLVAAAAAGAPPAPDGSRPAPPAPSAPFSAAGTRHFSLKYGR